VMLEWIAFDADDTLWKNEETYLEGRDVFLQILVNYGVGFEDLKKVDQVEVNNIKYYGYGVMSFVLSLIEMAIELTEERIRPGDIQILLDQGKKMLSADVEVFPGVDSLLENLSPEYRLMLITKGDLSHQQRKIKSSGLARHFQEIEVVSDKTPDVYLEILERHHIIPESFVMIGNSLRSDILPVLKLGGWAIFLKDHMSWSHENDPLNESDLDHYLEVGEISHIRHAIDRIGQASM
jgi:putative hydrolase of the HAD superfamily